MVVPAAVRAELVAHANAELPNEACGLILFEDDTAVEYVRGTNVSASPYHFELQIDPVTWADLNDRDVVQAVFHSHISSPPRPSRTDVQNIGLWAGPAVPHLHGAHGRARRVAHRRRRDSSSAAHVRRLSLAGAVAGPSRGEALCLTPQRDRADYLTVNEPFMNGCGSQMNL